MYSHIFSYQTNAKVIWVQCMILLHKNIKILEKYNFLNYDPLYMIFKKKCTITKTLKFNKTINRQNKYKDTFKFRKGNLSIHMDPMNYR